MSATKKEPKQEQTAEPKSDLEKLIAKDRSVLFPPFGESEELTLTMGQVRNYISNATASSTTPSPSKTPAPLPSSFEGMPLDLAAEIRERLTIPTIGIGAGPHCGGQILVLHDVLGLCDRVSPKFANRYAELWQAAGNAIGAYAREVRSGTFPSDAHSFHSLVTVPRDGKVAAEA